MNDVKTEEGRVGLRVAARNVSHLHFSWILVGVFLKDLCLEKQARRGGERKVIHKKKFFTVTLGDFLKGCLFMMMTARGCRHLLLPFLVLSFFQIKKVHEISERVREAAERVADSNSSPGSGSANTLTTPCGPPSSSASSPSRDRHSPSERAALSMDANGSGIPEDTKSCSTLSNRGWRVAATANTGPGGGGDQGGPSSRLQGQGGLRGTELSKPGGGIVHRGNHHGDGLVLDLENVTMLGEDDRDEFFIGDDDEQEMCKYVPSAEN